MEWIKTSDLLPAEKEYVFVVRNGTITIGYWFYMFSGVKAWQCLKTPFDFYEVPWVGAGHIEYWMRFPYPPETEVCKPSYDPNDPFGF